MQEDDEEEVETGLNHDGVFGKSLIFLVFLVNFFKVEILFFAGLFLQFEGSFLTEVFLYHFFLFFLFFGVYFLFVLRWLD